MDESAVHRRGRQLPDTSRHRGSFSKRREVPAAPSARGKAWRMCINSTGYVAHVYFAVVCEEEV